MPSDGADGRTHALEPAADVRLFRSTGANGLIDWLEVLSAPVLLTDPQHAQSS
jgi:hypothetical protein